MTKLRKALLASVAVFALVVGAGVANAAAGGRAFGLLGSDEPTTQPAGDLTTTTADDQGQDEQGDSNDQGEDDATADDQGEDEQGDSNDQGEDDATADDQGEDEQGDSVDENDSTEGDQGDTGSED
jgi:hypothetical protein